MKILACRCEDVTLHELDEAIARGHDDIESLKRYTGFGTGWCQGKACQALCARRLAEKKAPPEAPFTARPPYHPVSLAALAALPEEGDFSLFRSSLLSRTPPSRNLTHRGMTHADARRN